MRSIEVINIETVYLYAGINAIKGDEAEFIEEY